MADKDKKNKTPGKRSITNNMVDTPFPPEALPADVIKRLQESGVLQRSKPKDKPSKPSPPPVPKSPPAAPKTPAAAKKPPPAVPRSSSPPPTPPLRSPKSPPPAPKTAKPKENGAKTKLQPLIPNLQKLLKLISGGSILPTSISLENVRLDSDVIYIGKMDIGKVFDGKDGDGISVRIYFSKLNIQKDIPEIIRSKFPISDSILAINRTKIKFFIITSKDISLGIAKSEEDAPFLFIPGRL